MPTTPDLHAFVTTLEDHWRSSNAAAASGLPLDESRVLDARWGDVTAEPGAVDYAEIDAGGVPALWATPHDAGAGVLLCFHGGGFVGGSMWTHRKLFAHVAKAARARALIVDYRRTPEFQHPAPVDDCTAAYEWLLAQEVAPEHVAFAGDSAGGGLTLTTVLHGRQRGLPDPAALILVSPWTDMTFSGPSITTNASTDTLFGGETPMDLEGLVAMFLGPGGDRRDPLASPLFADLDGMPPMYVQAGGAEMLLDDARQIARRAKDAGVAVELDVVAGQQHSFQFDAGHGGEADAAITRLAEWVSPLLDR
jgi:epsilon-lactone hydrolase